MHNLKTISLFFILFTGTFLSPVFSAEPLWQRISADKVSGLKPAISAHKYSLFELQTSLLQNLLASENAYFELQIPMPDGTLQRYRASLAPVMAPALAQKYKAIKTFNLQSLHEAGVYGKADFTLQGFHAMIKRGSETVFIDPYAQGNTQYYMVYNVSDFDSRAKKAAAACKVFEHPDYVPSTSDKNRSAACVGEELRTYRLAVACTHEYALAATGLSAPTKAEVLSAIVTSINRVNQVYETEVAIHLELIANEDTIIFNTAASDPFTGNNDGGILIDESQTVIDDLVGNNNYDIGHTFSTGGGGLAYFQSVCDPYYKARGITGGSYPVGDPYDIDYVCHEIGHQFGGSHTFASNTGGCNGNGNSGTRVEPGSGVTIMAYAGLCGANDLAVHSIPYFHAVSFDEIVDFSQNNDGNNCAVISATGNHPPSVTVNTPLSVIPLGTPFVLNGTATDPDGDSLSYQWEETNVGVMGNWNSGELPYFRSYSPVATGKRFFPREDVVLSNNYTGTIGEYLPNMANTLNFRLTARDNKPGGGGVCSAETEVEVDFSGPLEITYPSTGVTWYSGGQENILWNVNSTNLPPVSCQLLNIYLSTDNGVTYTQLTVNTANDNNQIVSVPVQGVTQTNCRIKLESVNNIFYTVSKKFTISSNPAAINERVVSGNIQIGGAPNPFKEQFTLVCSGLEENSLTQFILRDLNGKIILENSYTSTALEHLVIDTQAWAMGMYILELRNAKQQAFYKMIKQ